MSASEDRYLRIKNQLITVQAQQVWGWNFDIFKYREFRVNKLVKHIEGSQPEWCISSNVYSRGIPFWSEPLDMLLKWIKTDFKLEHYRMVSYVACFLPVFA